MTAHDDDEDKVSVISSGGFRPVIVLVVPLLLQDFSLKYLSHFPVRHRHLTGLDGESGEISSSLAPVGASAVSLYFYLSRKERQNNEIGCTSSGFLCGNDLLVY